jgi:hypothetical protein
MKYNRINSLRLLCTYLKQSYQQHNMISYLIIYMKYLYKKPQNFFIHQHLTSEILGSK